MRITYTKYTEYADFVYIPLPANTLEWQVVDLMGELIVMKGRGSVSITQEALQWVAKASNFNILLQAFVMPFGTENDYRAKCSNCGEVKQLTDGIVTDPLGQSEAWVELGIFCDKHRHDGSNELKERLDEPQGRRFRHADKSGTE